MTLYIDKIISSLLLHYDWYGTSERPIRGIHVLCVRRTASICAICRYTLFAVFFTQLCRSEIRAHVKDICEALRMRNDEVSLRDTLIR